MAFSACSSRSLLSDKARSHDHTNSRALLSAELDGGVNDLLVRRELGSGEAGR